MGQGKNFLILVAIAAAAVIAVRYGTANYPELNSYFN